MRALIHNKRISGELAEALILARMGAQAVQSLQREGADALPDDVSRLALLRYLELIPEDAQARQQLELLGPTQATQPAPLQPAPVPVPVPGAGPGQQPAPSRLRHLWPLSLLALAGLVSAASVHFNGLPQLLAPAPVNAPVASIAPAASAAPVAAITSVVPVASVASATPATPILPPAASAPQAPDSAPIVIRAVGDVVLGSDYPERRLPSASDRQRMAALRLELRHADIVVGNLEGVLSDSGQSRKDASKAGLFTFRMPTAYAATLRDMGFDVLSLANNHSLDFGAQGLESTLGALRANGIAPVGVPGAETATLKIRNTTVAFLNYSYLPAFALLSDGERIRADIGQARSAANLVIVTVHGGKEGADAAGTPTGDEYFMNEYRGDLRKFARLSIDAGASAVFGHGPHVVRPYEMYRDKPIFYSLGNFVGYRSLSTQGKLANSIVAEVRLSPDGKLLGAGIIPLRLDRSGIPAVDYSADNVQTLSGLLLDKLAQRPVLELATRQAVAP
ncbi:MAG: CapA family protein [Polaromonas sp.]|nr:CapA family protein [Polaromonas sp.]